MKELAKEFPHDIGMGMREAAATGRRNMARMRWRMVWAKHRLQILREAESIVNPQEPWPYTQIIVEAPEALGDIADAHGEMLRVEEPSDRSRATTATTPPSSSSPDHQTAERQGEEEDGRRAVAATAVSTAVSTPTSVTSATRVNFLFLRPQHTYIYI